jgi:ATP-dependent DNA helicase HFM1/MER3
LTWTTAKEVFQAPKKASQASGNLSRRVVEDYDDLEIVDLAQEMAPVPYSDLAPRDYRKLHNLHTKVQADKIVRLPKQKPQFSYASGEQPDLSFLHKSKAHDDVFGSDSGPEDFPSPSRIMGDCSREPHTMLANVGSHVNADPFSSMQDDSLESIEAAMIGLDDSVILRRPSTPKVDSSFANQVFDFDAYNGKTDEQDIYSSPLMRETYKRARSPTPEVSAIKHRRVRKEDIMKEVLPIKHQTPGAQASFLLQDIPTTQETHKQSSVPLWVDDMDPDLIESLKGFVDFID